MWLGGVELPDDFVWLDEFEGTGVVVEEKWTIEGKRFERVFKKVANRPITLGGEISAPWVRRAELKALRDLADKGEVYELVLPDGRSFNVRFRYSDAPVIEARPVREISAPEDNDYYEVYAIKLITV